MSYTISSWEISIENRKQFRKALQEAMIERALYLCVGIDRRELEIRTLTPKDVGLKQWRTPPQKPDEVSTWINFEVAADQVLGIYKLIQLSKRPKVTTISFDLGLLGAFRKAHHDFEHLYALLPVLDKIRDYKAEDGIHRIFGYVDQMVMEAYLSEPIIYDCGDYLHLRVTSPEGNKSGDKLMLGGFVLNRVGKTTS